MPFNITKGNSAKFVVEYIDTNGDTTVPAGGTVYLEYPVGLSMVSEVMPMTLVNSFFTTTWASSVSDEGICPWYVVAAGSTIALSTGSIRVISP